MKKKILPYLLLAPMILIMGVLVFYPIITTFAYSLKRWKLTEPGNIHYIGFKNYIDILQSDSFKYSMQNTLFILVFVIVFTTIIGYLVSVYLNLECKCAGMLLAIAILPWALPPFVNGILWKFVFFSGYGFFNLSSMTMVIILCTSGTIGVGSFWSQNEQKARKEENEKNSIWNN